MSLYYVKDTLVSAGDDGFLYLWETERIIWRVLAHDGSIFALDCDAKRGMLVSGSIDGMVTLWQL